MSEIIKTEAIVLHKMNYSDSSLIVTLYTLDFGKLTAIVKGGRNPKSKKGFVTDPLNHLNIVLYKKDTREIQLLSSADIISHFPKIKEDYERLKYAYAVLELLKTLTPEHEENTRLFKGALRILTLFNASQQNPAVLFGRFFIFFITIIGYEIGIEECAVCGKSNLTNQSLSYNYEIGILCYDCRQNHVESMEINLELFKCLDGLKNNKKIDDVKLTTVERAITFMETYLRYHISDFKGIQSIQLFK